MQSHNHNANSPQINIQQDSQTPSVHHIQSPPKQTIANHTIYTYAMISKQMLNPKNYPTSMEPYISHFTYHSNNHLSNAYSPYYIFQHHI